MALSDSGREESGKRLSDLESKIEKREGKSALENLVQAGCDRNKLLQSLALCCAKPIDSLYDGWFTKLGPLSVESLFGLRPREFSTLKEKLLKAADGIDKINRRFEFGVLLTTPHLVRFQLLPSRLRGYVSLLDLAAERLGRGAYFYQNMAKAILVSYVKHQTGRSHEPEVCTLLEAVEGDYDVTKHREWSNDHRDLLDRVSPYVPIFASRDPGAVIEAAENAVKDYSPLPPVLTFQD